MVIAMFLVLPILAAPYMPDVLTNAMPDFIPIAVPPTPPLPKPKEIKPIDPPAGPPIDAPVGFTKEPLVIHDPGIVDTPGGLIGVGTIDDVIPPPPVVAPPPAPQEPVRISSGMRTPVKVRGADPVYPAIAQAARVQGIVIIEATLGADGHIINARILRSVPLLDQAALDAVRQWQYTPTMLNGVPVPVIMTVTVQFTLSK